MKIIAEWRDGLEWHCGRIVGYAPSGQGNVFAIVLQETRLLRIPLQELTVITAAHGAKRKRNKC
jgi:hypothetical protein